MLLRTKLSHVMCDNKQHINSGILSVIKHNSATFVHMRNQMQLSQHIGDGLSSSTYMCLEVNCSSLPLLKRTPFHAAYRAARTPSHSTLMNNSHTHTHTYTRTHTRTHAHTHVHTHTHTRTHAHTHAYTHTHLPPHVADKVM